MGSAAINHTIYLFATTEYPTTLFMSQDDGDTWTVKKDFTTVVSAGDTIQWKIDLGIGSIPNNISEITNIHPANFFEPAHSPNRHTDWKGTIKKDNPAGGVEIYTINYMVAGFSGAVFRDPIIRMKN